MENVAIKGRGGNDVQHKTWIGKILRIWITIIRHGGLGHEVQEAWPYLSNGTPWPYELSPIQFFIISCCYKYLINTKLQYERQQKGVYEMEFCGLKTLTPYSISSD